MVNKSFVFATMSMAVLQLSHTLTNNILVLQLSYLSYSVTYVGIFSAVFFIGSVLGSFFYQKVLNRLQDVNTMILMISLISIIILSHIIFDNAMFLWLLRLFYGFIMINIINIFRRNVFNQATNIQYFNKNIINPSFVGDFVERGSRLVARSIISLLIVSYNKFLALAVILIQISGVLFFECSKFDKAISKASFRTSIFKKKENYIPLFSFFLAGMLNSTIYLLLLVISLSRLHLPMTITRRVFLFTTIGEVFFTPIVMGLIQIKPMNSWIYQIIFCLIVVHIFLITLLRLENYKMFFFVLMFVGTMLVLLKNIGVEYLKSHNSSINYNDLSFSLSIVQHLAGAFSSILFIFLIPLFEYGFLSAIIILLVVALCIFFHLHRQIIKTKTLNNRSFEN